jgi:NADH-quinone oxidoreductase subunit L
VLWLPIFVPVFAGVAIGVAAPRRRLGAAAALAMLVTTLLGVWAARSQAHAGLSWGGPLQLEFAITGAARILIVLVPAVAGPVIAFASWHYADDPGLRRLIGLLLAFVGTMELLVAAGDLISLLIGWELVAAFSWALIAHHWREPRPPQAALEAYLTVRLGAVGLFVAAGAVFSSTGSVSYAALGHTGRPWLDIAAAGVLLAAASKSAQVPFSQWLFSAMEGPTPVSALLHSATMVAAGAYVLIRLAPHFATLGWFGPTVVAIGLVTAVAGGIVAALQTDFKKALAGSTSAQYGLMFVAVGAAATPAAAAQLVTHAFFKSLLFLGAGVALATAGTGSLAALRLGRAKRVVTVLFGVGVLALAAVPPLGGGFSKEAVVAAAFAYSPWLGAGVLVAGLLSAFYAARLFVLAYGRPRDDPSAPPAIVLPAPPRVRVRATSRQLPSTEIWTIGLLAAGSLLLGLARLPVVWRALERVTAGHGAAEPLWQLAVSIVTIAAAFALVRSLDRRHLLLSLGLESAVQAGVADWLGAPAVVRRGVAEPVFAVARTLRRLDDHVIDAGVWNVAKSAIRSAGRIRSLDERVVDGAVRGVAALGLLGAAASRLWDDLGIDGAVEWIARASWWSGKQVRRLQSGLSHHYYVIVAVGLVVAVAVAAIRS